MNEKEDVMMKQENMDRARKNARNVVAGMRKDAADRIAGAKAIVKKARADGRNTVDRAMADVMANAASMRADRDDRVKRNANTLRANMDARVEKARSNIRRYRAYAKADAERSTRPAKPKKAHRPK
jgi:hypothetical protein